MPSKTRNMASKQPEPEMDVSSGDTPSGVYSRQLNHLRQAQISDHKRERLLGYSKVLLAISAFIAAVVFMHHPVILESMFALLAIIVPLAVLHERLLRSMRLRDRAIRFYECGLARLEDRWAETGETGDRFRNPAHPYARDLDLFGTASLFELLCTARTRAGEETLAAWLLSPAPVDEILHRQAAIRDLKDRVQFRENLFSLGETVRLGVQPASLASWGERPPAFPARATRIVTTTLSILWILSLVVWAIWGLATVPAAITVLNLAWAHRIHARLDEASDSLENASQDLKLLAGVLALLENEHFSAPRLVRIQAALKRNQIAPSTTIRKLARIVSFLESRRNPAARLLDVITFWSAYLVFAAERWQLKFGPQIRGWLASVGEFEALTALSGYAYEHGNYVFPEFVPPSHAPLFDAEALAHPLLPSRKAVPNDVKFADGLELIILSGPNMTGKSTFIRSIGVNAVLALCGAPVCARKLRLSPLAVAASICVLDSLSGSVSRFYAEIQRVKLIADLARGPVPVLFLLDELLSGTNSHDRLEGTKLVVQSLTARGAIGIVSTHDLALTKIPDAMQGRAINCHFQDRFENGKLAFDYKLKDGIVQTSNALELMRSIGLGAEN